MSDRKYRHGGYQDDDGREEKRPSRSAGPGPRPPSDRYERPGGRGLGKPTANVFRCARCGEKQPVGEVRLDETCVKCSSDLHTCTNCAHFDTGARNECRKPVKDYVSAKAKSNRCELFEPKSAKEFATETPAADNPRDAKSAFDALFKNL